MEKLDNTSGLTRPNHTKIFITGLIIVVIGSALTINNSQPYKILLLISLFLVGIFSAFNELRLLRKAGVKKLTPWYLVSVSLIILAMSETNFMNFSIFGFSITTFLGYFFIIAAIVFFAKSRYPFGKLTVQILDSAAAGLIIALVSFFLYVGYKKSVTHTQIIAGTSHTIYVILAVIMIIIFITANRKLLKTNFAAVALLNVLLWGFLLKNTLEALGYFGMLKYPAVIVPILYSFGMLLFVAAVQHPSMRQLTLVASEVELIPPKFYFMKFFWLIVSVVLPVISMLSYRLLGSTLPRVVGGAGLVLVGILMSLRLDVTFKSNSKLHAEITNKDNIDPLTGLVSYQKFIKNINERHAATSNVSLAGVIALDIKNFSRINDSLGRGAGDDLLKELATRITLFSPISARESGDEFLCYWEGSTLEEFSGLFSKLRQASQKVFTLDNQPIFIDVLGGGAVSELYAASFDAGSLVSNAFIALHNSKVTNNSNFVLFDSNHRKITSRYLEIEQSLKQPPEEVGMGVWYQAIVDIKTYKVVGFEALSRWYHPSLGPISPQEFIAVAEETGDIKSLGLWVLEKAVSQLAEWLRISPPNQEIHMSINVSPVQLYDTSIVSSIENIIKKFDIDPSLIWLEITESISLTTDIKIELTLDLLRKLGVRLAIDDFGSGYSSFSTLNSNLAQVLKIDKSIIDSIQVNPDATMAIIAVARSLGMLTLAEGVENYNQAIILKKLGCDFIQGWLFSKAEPATKIPKFLYEEPAVIEALHPSDTMQKI